MDATKPTPMLPGADYSLPAVLRPAVIGLLAPFRPREVVLPAATPAELVNNNPQRIGFYVIRDPHAVGLMTFSPWSDPDAYGLRIDGPGGFGAVIADVWFALTQTAWYGQSAPGETVLVIELIRPF